MQAKLICFRNINEMKIHYTYIGINCFKRFSDFYQLMYFKCCYECQKSCTLKGQ